MSTARLLAAAAFLAAAAAAASQGFSPGVEITGVSESKAGLVLALPDGEDACSAEQFANIRLRAPIGEAATFFAAANAAARTGSAQPSATEAELERLYITLSSGAFDFNSGLMRLPFGYGQALRPTDILNPPNPLFPEARLKGILAASLSWYPRDELKIQSFIADDGKATAGLSADFNARSFSAQGLYAARISERAGKRPVSSAGFSLKLEAGAGFTLDALYTFDGKSAMESGNPDSTLRAALGADYSVLDGKLFMLAQYFYNGAGPLETADGLDVLYGTEDWHELPAAARMRVLPPADFYRRHYLFASLLYQADDYTRFSVSCLAGVEDVSFSPALKAEREIAQGFTVALTSRVPVDRAAFGSGSYGELGPENSGYRGSATLGAYVKF